MFLDALNSRSIQYYEELNKFLAEDHDSALRLGPYSNSKFDVVGIIGCGQEGLVLRCYDAPSNEFFALKLFFQGQNSNQAIWPLKNEVQYYVSCAGKRSYFSNSANPLLLLPELPFMKWLCPSSSQSNKELFNMIEEDMMTDQLEAKERLDILHLLNKMCAYGWVAFAPNKVSQILSNLRSQHSVKFTGPLVIGIVKPFFKGKDPRIESLRRQFQWMLLMRAFGWRLREVQDRNWIDGYLVDGGDVEIDPEHLRYLERCWCSAFFQFVKNHSKT